ncbi:hypothetical protein FFF34_007270 [Inquilinus sp. KBS0705]|nr:hypothetical protein FFF34_007270 [Inquilinus sp. KBS0705]
MRSKNFHSRYVSTFRYRIDFKEIIVPSGLILISLIKLNDCFYDIYSGNFKTPTEDICYLTLLLLSTFKLLSLLFGKSEFKIDDGKLIVTTGLFKQSKSYFVNEMMDIEAEQVKTKWLFSGKVTDTQDKIISFFYKEKEVALGFDLKGFDADELKEELLSSLSRQGG